MTIGGRARETGRPLLQSLGAVALLVALSWITGLQAIAPAQAKVVGHGCTLTGTPGPDELRGGRGKDVICARGGNDVVFGGNRRDLILGGPGDDELHGDAGSDEMAGGPGNDMLDGGSGTNSCAANRLRHAPSLCVGFVTIRDLSIRPQRVNTAKGFRRLRVEVGMTDARPEAPVELFGVTVQREGSELNRIAGALTLVRGTPTRGRWSGTVLIPQQSHPGTYEIGLLTTADINSRLDRPRLDQFRAPKLRRAGFDNDFKQTGPGTNDPPTVSELSFSPSQIDTSQAAQTTELRFRVEDDGGVGAMSFFLQGPTPAAHQLVFPGAGHRVSGDARDGVYSVPVSLRRYSAPGEWRVESVTVNDEFTASTYNAGDLIELGLDPRFEQIGPGDLAPPVLRGFFVSPRHVDVTAGGGAALDVDISLADDLSGLESWTVSLPGSPQTTHFVPQQLEVEEKDIIFFPGGAPPPGSDPAPPPAGTYEFEVKVTDLAGNVRTYTSADLAAAGFTPSIYNGP